MQLAERRRPLFRAEVVGYLVLYQTDLFKHVEPLVTVFITSRPSTYGLAFEAFWWYSLFWLKGFVQVRLPATYIQFITSSPSRFAPSPSSLLSWPFWSYSSSMPSIGPQAQNPWPWPSPSLQLVQSPNLPLGTCSLAAVSKFCLLRPFFPWLYSFVFALCLPRLANLGQHPPLPLLALRSLWLPFLISVSACYSVVMEGLDCVQIPLQCTVASGAWQDPYSISHIRTQ